MPTGAAARAERALRVGAERDGAALLADALTAAALAVDENGDGLPEIVGAHLIGERVELTLASSPVDHEGQERDVASPFMPTGDRRRWSVWVADVGKGSDDPDGAELLSEAALLAGDVMGDRLPEVVGARLIPGRVVLLLGSAATEVAEPFQASEDGLVWSASADDVARVVGAVAKEHHPSCPAPTMVTLGVTVTGTLALNLERIGLLALEGDPDRAAGVLRRMAFELGARPFYGFVNVVLVGLPEVSGLGDHVQTAENLGDALDQAASGGTRWWNEASLAVTGARSADAARAAGLDGDTWPPSVVLAAGAFTDEELQRAAEVTADPARAAIAVVVATDRARTPWVVDLSDDLIDIGPTTLAMDLSDRREAPTRVLGYDILEAKAVSSVLETAARTDDVSPSEPPYGQARLRVVPDTEGRPPPRWWWL